MLTVRTVSDFRRIYRAGPYAWPGSYPCYFVTADGGVLSWKAAKECRREILHAIASDDSRSGWRVVAVEVNYEDANLVCDHTGEKIPAAYVD
jgi:hypothetical protein